MNEQFQSAILEDAERLLHTARTDDRLRSSLRLCAEQDLALTTETVPPAVEKTPSLVGGEQPVVAPALSPKPRQVAGPFNLTLTQRRLVLKAEVARWAAERPRRLAEGADLSLEIRPQDQEFIRRGLEESCYLWLIAPDGRRPYSPDQFTLIAAWYENLAEALALLNLVIAEVGWKADEITPALELAAAAQSALRVAVAECEKYGDQDQQATFDWLKEVAAEHEIFIREGMKLDAPTDPSEWGEIARHIQALATEFRERQHSTRKRKKLLATVRHKASLLAATPSGPPEAWGELMTVVDELVKAGLPASNKELREALMPVLDRFPAQAEVPDGFRLVVRETEKFKHSRPVQETSTEYKEQNAVVRNARKLLEGRSAVLIGGEGRAEAKQSLEEALGLKELIWISTSKHDSYLDFERFIARPDVAVVMLAIRWASHSFSQVSKLCDRYGKPFVRLSGAYNPNQVAQQIVNQAGKRLVKP